MSILYRSTPISKPLIRTSIAALSLGVLAACGGGGGDSTAASGTDTQAPEINIMGDNDVSISHGASYSDLGASAEDSVDGIVNIQSQSNVDTSVVGEYTVSYTATDNAGNTVTVERTVHVIDDLAPEIQLNGANLMEMQIGDIYQEPGALANDNADGAVTVDISGTVNTAVIGEYTLEYTATDQSGNSNTIQRTVSIIPTRQRVELSYFGEATFDINSDHNLVCDQLRSCYAMVTPGEELSITVIPESGWALNKWSGCSTVDSQTCQLTVNEDTLISAAMISNAALEVNDAIIILEDDQVRSISDYNTQTGTLTLEATADINGFDVGKIIVSTGIYISADNPANVEIYFARRIQQVIQLTGSSILIATTEVTLEDIIDDGTVTIDEVLTSQKLIPSSLPQGITLNPEASPGFKAQEGGVSQAVGAASIDLIPLSLNVVVYDRDGDSNTKFDQVRINGTVDLNIQPDINIDFSPFVGLREFRTIVRTNSTAALSVNIGGQLDISNGEWPLGAPIRFAPIVVGPIVFIPAVQLFATYSVHVDAAYEPEITISARIVGGAHYLRSAGWQSVNSASFNVGADVAMESLNIAITAEAGPKVATQLLLFGVAGPEVSAEILGGITASPVLPITQTCSWDFDVFLKFNSKFAGRFTLLSKTMSYDVTLMSIKKVVEQFSRDCAESGELLTPENLSISDIEVNQLTLNWDYPVEERAGITYSVFRDLAKVQEALVDTTFIDTKLNPNQEYCYLIAAVNTQGEISDYSFTACATTLPEDNQPPPAPFLQELEAVSTSAISLTWTDSGEDAQSYIVYDASGQDPYAMQQVTELSTAIVSLLPETEYCYQVSAMDAAGNQSMLSNQQCITTLAAKFANWTAFLGCQNREYIIEEKFDLDIDYSALVSIVGTGFDYPGTPLAYSLSGTYNAGTGILDAEIIWTFENSPARRRDIFSANLSSGNTGDVPMTQVEVTGCNAQILLEKEGTTNSAQKVTLPQSQTPLESSTYNETLGSGLQF